MDRPLREIRACYDEKTIRVYQAYSHEIADPALSSQKFVSPFKRTRMTWIKPSFTWMMYRSGWASKPGQERVLGIDISRSGFEWALSHSCLSHFEASVHENSAAWEILVQAAPVRIQWDPERTLHLQPLQWRAIQIGLGPQAIGAYVDEWTVRIEDVTPLAKSIEGLLKNGEAETARALLPKESPYPTPTQIAHLIGCDESDRTTSG